MNRLTPNDIERVISLIEDLQWDYDRLSSSGRETLDELFTLLNLG